MIKFNYSLIKFIIFTLNALQERCMDDVVWESLCEQLWRGSLLAKDVKVEDCARNPLFGPWSQCRASQTNLDRQVTMLDVALPSAYCSLAQPGAPLV